MGQISNSLSANSEIGKCGDGFRLEVECPVGPIPQQPQQGNASLPPGTLYPSAMPESEFQASEYQAPDYEAAVVELLGVLAYGELSAFERLCADAAMAPTLNDKAEIAAMACAEFSHFELLRTRLTALGADPQEAMAPFVVALEAFHASTAPADWLEGLVKAYVGDGIAADFYREISVLLDADTRQLVLDVFADTGHSEFVVYKVRAAIEAEPRVAGRLALWGRRLMGEALSQAQRVAADRDSLASLLAGAISAGGASDMDFGELGRMFTRITEQHSRRMAALGLAA